ncbi:PAL OF QUIRKY-like protein [Drosera capensis]
MDPPPPPPSASPNTTTAPTPQPPDLSAKLRLMVSYGGHIVPRPHDKSLCYIGGDTRIVVVPRHLLPLPDLISRLSNNINTNNIGSFVVKYQLPNEDLDSLITVSTDDDLENLIDEYDRLVAASKPSRLRLFLFPAKGKGSTVLDGNAVRSAEWFLGELNGGRGGAGLRRGFSDPNSVNCLLGLEESGGGDGDSKGEEGEAKRGSGEGKLTTNSVPGSPIVETATSSSSGSSNSSPSLANLAPIRSHVEGGGSGGERVRVSDLRIGEIDEQFSQLNVNVSKHDEDLVVMPSTVVTPVAVGVAPASPGASGVGGNVNRVVSDDERSDQDVAVGFRKSSGTEDQPVMVSSLSQQKLNGGYDLPSPDSVSSDGSHSSALSRQKQMIFQEPSGQVPSLSSRVTANFIDSKVGIVSDSSITAQVQQNSDSSNTPSTQYDLQHKLLQQQQFVHAVPHYVQHPPPGAASYSPYYPLYASQHPQFNHHPGPYPLYYTPAGLAQPYGLPVQQPNFADSANTVPASRPQTPSMISTSAMYSTTRNLPTQKLEMATGIYRTAAGAAAPPLVQVGTGPHHLPLQQQQFVGYPQMYPPAQSITPAPFEYADPAHTQMYFSQPLQPALAAQYQTLTSDSAVLSPDVTALIPPDNVKQQIESSLPV